MNYRNGANPVLAQPVDIDLVPQRQTTSGRYVSSLRNTFSLRTELNR